MNVTVLCVDDKDYAETFDLHFERDYASRIEEAGHEPRRLVRYGDVRVSERAARGPLLRAGTEGLLPDIVFIDQRLRGDARDAYDEEGGLRLMAGMRDEFRARGVRLPACVLCASRFNPGLAHTFVRCGGVQAIDASENWSDRVAAIWQGYDWHVDRDGHWTHRPKRGCRPFTIPPASAALLPYLEADVPNAAIAMALGITKDAVLDRRRKLVERINEQVPPEQLPDGRPVVVNGRSTSLAQIASDHGHVWVPLAYAKYVTD